MAAALSRTDLSLPQWRMRRLSPMSRSSASSLIARTRRGAKPWNTASKAGHFASTRLCLRPARKTRSDIVERQRSSDKALSSAAVLGLGRSLASSALPPVRFSAAARMVLKGVMPADLGAFARKHKPCCTFPREPAERDGGQEAVAREIARDRRTPDAAGSPAAGEEIGKRRAVRAQDARETIDGEPALRMEQRPRHLDGKIGRGEEGLSGEVAAAGILGLAALVAGDVGQGARQGIGRRP